MKRHPLPFLLIILPFIQSSILPSLFAEAETIDLKALAKKARPAVMLLVVSDTAGKEIATGTGFLSLLRRPSRCPTVQLVDTGIENAPTRQKAGEDPQIVLLTLMPQKHALAIAHKSIVSTGRLHLEH